MISTGEASVSTRRFLGLSSRWWWAITYGTAVTTLAAASYLARVPAETGETVGFGRALLWQGAVYGSWAILVPLLAWLARRTRVGEGSWLVSAGVFSVASLLIVPAHAALTAWVSVRLGSWSAVGSPSLALATIERLPVDLLLYWAVVGVLFATSYHAGMLSQARAAGRLEAALARSELHALRAQLEPHFLFNALQAISALIPRDPQAAQLMTVRLGDLLRTTLRRIGESEVTLAEELALLAHYVEIEGVRFGDRLHVQYDIAPDTLDCMVPDLALQPLVENAIRHGVGPLERGGRVMVEARCVDEWLELEVIDDGVGLPANWRGGTATGLGLGITEQRLQHTYGGRAQFTVERATPRGTAVRMRLPMRRALAEAALVSSASGGL